MRELDLKVQLLAVEAEHAGNLQKRLQAKIADLESAKKDLESKESAINKKSCNNGHLERELGSAPATIGRGDRVVHDLAECICSDYASLMRAQASRY